MKYNPPIIVGAGIAGLSSALALAHKGIKSIVIEKRKKIDTAGAGIQVTPNATRILAHWGILDRLIKAGIQPHFLQLRDGTSLKTHLQIDLIECYEKRWKFPYLTIHRADLQKILYETAIEHPLITCKIGEAFISSKKATINGASVIEIQTVNSTQKQQYQPYTTSLLIGCDGVWSKLRQLTPFCEKADFSGLIAWRATISSNNLSQNVYPLLQSTKTITAWLGSNNHLVIYPIQPEKTFNIVAITYGENSEKKWNLKGEKNELKSLFSKWNPKILQLIDHIDDWRYWPLFQMKQDRFLGLENQVFVGDCAHAALPFAAQGSSMAIEDAATLAETISASNLSLQRAVSLYEKIRRPRIAAIKKQVNFNKLVYHASGPLAIARNFMMKIRTAENIISDLDWLYTYDAINLTKSYITQTNKR
ncbi:FAD-binding protein [Bartonella ancashensis]|uniref:Salicylate hydroxylase n=1 Tax=Bartonella ancashensis TaxID=1318743 RepID=A0A0M3T2Z9_9HYPH|nr:FAD-binding protein [Bartonella ancashensis]ALE03731.1 Salicylate hydroxylase [Bartonella ancashensis]